MREISNEDLTKIQKRFSQKDIEEAVVTAFDSRIKRAREMKDEMYADYEKAMRKGVPFKERESLIDESKARWSENETKKLNEWRRKYKVMPFELWMDCLLYTSPSPRDGATSRMPSSA